MEKKWHVNKDLNKKRWIKKGGQLIKITNINEAINSPKQIPNIRWRRQCKHHEKDKYKTKTQSILKSESYF